MSVTPRRQNEKFSWPPWLFLEGQSGIMGKHISSIKAYCTLRSQNFLTLLSVNLSEIKTEFENGLNCLAGAQMGMNHEKIEVKVL